MDKKLDFYGGKLVVFAPIVLALIGLMYIAFKNANIPEYWVVFLLPLVFCILLAKNKTLYSKTIIRGLTDEVAAILFMAIILAGINGALLSKSGVVTTLSNLLASANFVGGKFVAATFVITCIIAFSTGTSTGTVFVAGPILYPIGCLLGGNPAMVIGAIVSGGAFGDNLSPVSDTTIASATTQGMDLGGVVKSRLKYALPVAFISMLLYLFLDSGGTAMDSAVSEIGEIDMKSLFFLLMPIVIIICALAKRHLIEALSMGIITGIIIGLLCGYIGFGDLISVPEQFGAGGIILEGIQGALPTAVIVIFLFAHINLLKEAGGIDIIVEFMGRFVKGVKSAEATIVTILIALNCATGLNTAAILGTGPIAKELGEKYNIDGYRRANLLDCSGTTLNYLLPYMVPVLIASMITSLYPPVEGAALVTPIEICTHQFYPIIMAIMLVFSIISGYGRTFISNKKILEKS